MTLSINELRRIHATLDDNTTFEDLLETDPHPLSIPKTFPPAADITLLTLNFFDNGTTERSRWTKARYAMNLQVYTLTKPFSPTADLAAWTGTIQLHSTSFVGRYLTARFPDEEPIARPIIAETDKLEDRFTDVLLGQVCSKSGGTHYEWGTMLRTYTDDLAEFGADLLHEGRTITAQSFTAINDPQRPTLKMVGRYDPHRLWKTNKKIGRTTKKAPRP